MYYLQVLKGIQSTSRDHSGRVTGSRSRLGTGQDLGHVPLLRSKVAGSLTNFDRRRFSSKVYIRGRLWMAEKVAFQAVIGEVISGIYIYL